MHRLCCFLLLCLLVGSCRPSLVPGASGAAYGDPLVYLTTPDSSALLELQEGGGAPIAIGEVPGPHAALRLNPELRYQTMQGFGFTLTGGSATLIHTLPTARRADLLRELFGPGPHGIGISYLRISLGASDLDPAPFSYDDLPAGETDPELEHFSLAPDRRHLIPLLREILAVRPDLRLMASPWSPPAWMKDNGATKGGSLRPEFYPVYARYFVRYLQEMAAEGIRVDAVTVQNEPLHPGNNPSLLMPAEAQATFVGEHLGPTLAAAGLDTRIVIYDHNADRPDYPLTVLDDDRARPYIDGTAFHLYAGPIDALSTVHAAYPDKHLYFTEQWIGAPGDFAGDLRWHTEQLFIGAPRNWAETVLEWNLAADARQEPHTPGGCTRCLGALTIEGGRVHRNTAYYNVAHSSRFVPPGSVRIGSEAPPELPNVAYATPDGAIVVLLLNTAAATQTVDLKINGRKYPVTLPAGAVATSVFEPAR